MEDADPCEGPKVRHRIPARKMVTSDRMQYHRYGPFRDWSCQCVLHASRFQSCSITVKDDGRGCRASPLKYPGVRKLKMISANWHPINGIYRYSIACFCMGPSLLWLCMAGPVHTVPPIYILPLPGSGRQTALGRQVFHRLA